MRKIPTETIFIKSFYLTIFAFLAFVVTGNATVDSIRQILNNESYPDSVRFNSVNEFYSMKAYTEPSIVIELAENHYNLAKRKNAIRELGNAIFHKALAFKIMGDYDSALTQLDTLVDIRGIQKDSIGLAQSYRQKGVIYHYKSKYSDAVNCYLKSLAIYQEQKLLSKQAKVLSGLAMVYSEINNFDLAMDYYDQSAQLFQRLGEEDKLSHLSANLGFTQFEKKNYREAILNGKKSMEYFHSINHQVGLADSYYLLAQSYKALNQIDSSLYFVEHSLEINLSIGNPGQIIPTKLLYADILFEIDFEKATNMAEELLPLVDTSFGYAYMTQLHHLLYRCYKEKNNVTQALDMHEKFSLYRDSLLIEEDGLAITRHVLEAKYEIELLNKQLESEQKQAALEYSQLKKTFALILGGMLVIFVIGFYARHNILSQRREKEALLNEIEQLKSKGESTFLSFSPEFRLQRDRIEDSISRKINETDWKVLNILFDDPVITNKDIAQKAFLTVDGIGSCLRRMYIAFEIKESKYKKISLIMKAIKISNSTITIAEK